MDFDNILSSMTLDIYQRLKNAVELGKWPDGRVLTQQQTEVLLQATLAYASRENLSGDELFTISAKGELLDAKSQKRAYRKKQFDSQHNNKISIRTEHK